MFRSDSNDRNTKTIRLQRRKLHHLRAPVRICSLLLLMLNVSMRRLVILTRHLISLWFGANTSNTLCAQSAIEAISRVKDPCQACIALPRDRVLVLCCKKMELDCVAT